LANSADNLFAGKHRPACGNHEAEIEQRQGRGQQAELRRERRPGLVSTTWAPAVDRRGGTCPGQRPWQRPWKRPNSGPASGCARPRRPPPPSRATSCISHDRSPAATSMVRTPCGTAKPAPSLSGPLPPPVSGGAVHPGLPAPKGSRPRRAATGILLLVIGLVYVAHEHHLLAQATTLRADPRPW
jgi:hypothetical protein